MTAAEIQLNVVAQSLQAMSEVIATLAKQMPQRAEPQHIQPVEPKRPLHLTTIEAAEMMKCRPNTLAIWRLRGMGPKYIALGHGKRRSIRYSVIDIENYMNERTIRGR
jgi:hypothetical protein